MLIHRRDFLRAGAGGLAALLCGGLPRALADALSGSVRAVSRFVGAHPCRNITGAFDGTALLGDEHKRPHDILWHLEEYISRKGGRPATVAEEAEVIIVGGGTAGLLSAYRLRDRDFLVLEQASQFGGNARSEAYEGGAFSLGPAYVTKPAAGSAEEAFFRETNLLPLARHEAPAEARVLAGSLRSLTAEAGAAGESARALAATFRSVREALPSVPPAAADDSPALSALDELSAEAWLAREGAWHPLVMEQLQLYAWSSLGGSLEEISAAQFLNFIAAEEDGILAFPGGNGAITGRLYEILNALGEDRLRSSTMVLEIKEVPEGVELLAEAADGTLRRFRAKSLVMAAPKYAARFLLKGLLPPARDALWKDLPYRAYAVGNVLLEERAPAPAFDIYCLRGSVPPAPSFGRRTDRPITDLVFANWAGHDAGPTVLTLYRPYPFEGSRNFLLGPQAHERLRREMSADLPRWLAELGLGGAKVAGLRVALWGHSVPLAKPGFLAADKLAALADPVGPRIFLANQDNYMSPAFEACFAAAVRAEAGVRALL